MTNTLFTTNAFFAWHELAKMFAYAMLGGLLLYALVQSAIARSGDGGLRWRGGGSLRSVLIIGFTLVGIVPALALGILLAERSAHSRQDRMELRIEDAAAAAAEEIDAIVDKHVTGIRSAAAAINANGLFNQTALNQPLLLHNDIYPGFVHMLATDASGNVVAATMVRDGELVAAEETDGINVSAREYFTDPMASGLTYVSQPYTGRVHGRNKVLTFSAALLDDENRRVGIVMGSMKLDLFADIDKQRSSIDGAVLVVVDESNRVVFSSEETEMQFGDSLAYDPMILASLAARRNDSFDFLAESDDTQSRYMSSYATTASGWRAFVRVPVEPIAQQMLADYRVSGLLLLLSCLISVLLASAVILRVSRSVRDMNAAIESFTFDGSGVTVSVPRNTPTEFRPLFRAMRKRTRQLQRAHRKLNTAEAANKRLAGQSKRDALTNIANRREFAAFEKRAWDLAARDRTSLAVLMLDIDLFKAYNDALGHQAGDDCLVRVARALEACASRPLDLVARYGGEEFVVVLGNVTVTEACVVAERMREAVLDLEIEHPATSTGLVSISAGVAGAVPEPGQGADSLIKAADEALYYAKAAGRNCVVFKHAGEYVTYEDSYEDLSATNVIKMLANRRGEMP